MDFVGFWRLETTRARGISAGNGPALARGALETTMDPKVSEYLNLIFRWAHVMAGIMWVGHLWFFNFVNAQVAKTYDADSKKKVLPELMPRALYWFRWGAAYTFISGIVLLFIVYWFGGAMGQLSGGPHAAGGIGLVAIIVGFAI